jgi:carboxylate-amine ligase
MDSNYPEIILTAAALVVGAAARLRRDGLTVVPDHGVRAFEVDGEELRVPGFGYLGKELLRAAVTEGVESPEVTAYVDSVLEFVGGEERLAELRRDRRSSSGYPTTEARILREYHSENGRLAEKEGLRLVLDACDELEAQASDLPPGG